MRPITGRGGGGGKGGGGSQPARAAQEAPNTLRSKAVARVIDLLCAGPIRGLTNPNGVLLPDAYLGMGIYYNDTPMMNAADASFNFTGAQVDWRQGVPNQLPMHGFVDTEAEVSVGTKVTYAQPVTRTITNPNADAVRVTVRVPSLLSQDTSTGDVNGTQLRLVVQIKPSNGGFTSLIDDTIDGKTTSPYERSYRIELFGLPPWDVRVHRISADSASVALQNDLYFSSYTEIVDDPLSYPNVALVAHAVDSQLFGGSIPNRAYEGQWLEMPVPANYDPDLRTYTGLWDGTFQIAWTDNPAWIYRYLLLDPDNGLGNFIDAEQVDDSALYAIAQYCDALVPDGFGGMEPRFTYNGVINTRGEAYAVLQMIAACFRGMAYWGAGTVTATQDRPEDPVMLVAPANVEGGQIAYQGSALSSRSTAILVSWNNPADGYKADVEVVEASPELIRLHGYRTKSVVASGCTSRGQARRLGKWMLDEEWNETETATYVAGLDHAFVRPGHVLKIADPSVAGVRFGGRVADASSTSITLDAPIDLVVGETYTVSVVLPDGTIADRPLTNAPGSASILTWSSALATPPSTDAMWAVTGSDVAPRQFRVVGITEPEPHKLQVSALIHEPNKYARIEQDVRFDATPYSRLPTGPIKPPTNITVAERFYISGASVLSAATISWQAAADARVVRYELEARKPDQIAFYFIDDTETSSLDVTNTAQGLWGFRVRSIDGLGRKSAWATLDPVLIQALALATDDVTQFDISILGPIALLTWAPVLALNVDHYRIKFSLDTSGAATWDAASDLVPPVKGTSVNVPAMVGTYLIKAVNTLGIECANADLIVSTIAGVEGLNAIATITEDPAFSGTKTRVGVVSSKLQLSGAGFMVDWTPLASVVQMNGGFGGIASTGTYLFAGTLDLGAVFTSRVTASIDAFGENVHNVMAGWSSLAMLTMMSGAEAGSWSVTLQIRTTPDDPAGSPTWSDWMTFMVGDYTSRAFEWQLLLESFDPAITPVVQGLTVNVDMPDRIAGDRNIAVPNTGQAITFSPAFKAVPAIAVDGKNLATGDYYTVTSPSATGFTVQFFNAANAGVARTMDWLARGYGYKQ